VRRFTPGNVKLESAPIFGGQREATAPVYLTDQTGSTEQEAPRRSDPGRFSSPPTRGTARARMSQTGGEWSNTGKFVRKNSKNPLVAVFGVLGGVAVIGIVAYLALGIGKNTPGQATDPVPIAPPTTSQSVKQEEPAAKESAPPTTTAATTTIVPSAPPTSAGLQPSNARKSTTGTTPSATAPTKVKGKNVILKDFDN